MCGDMGVGPGWDCGRCRLDGPNGLFLRCRVSMMIILQDGYRGTKGTNKIHKDNVITERLKLVSHSNR